jgi:biotin-(acetyl-CoA carboxylase) ligase
LRRRVWKSPEGDFHWMRVAWRAQRREKPANSAAAQSSVLAMASPLKGRAIIRIWMDWT